MALQLLFRFRFGKGQLLNRGTHLPIKRLRVALHVLGVVETPWHPTAGFGFRLGFRHLVVLLEETVATSKDEDRTGHDQIWSSLL